MEDVKKLNIAAQLKKLAAQSFVLVVLIVLGQQTCQNTAKGRTAKGIKGHVMFPAKVVGSLVIANLSLGLATVHLRIHVPSAINATLTKLAQVIAVLIMLMAQKSKVARKKLRMIAGVIVVRTPLKLRALVTPTQRQRQMRRKSAHQSVRASRRIAANTAASSATVMQTAQAAVVGQTQNVLRPR